MSISKEVKVTLIVTLIGGVIFTLLAGVWNGAMMAFQNSYIAGWAIIIICLWGVCAFSLLAVAIIDPHILRREKLYHRGGARWYFAATVEPRDQLDRKIEGQCPDCDGIGFLGGERIDVEEGEIATCKKCKKTFGSWKEYNDVKDSIIADAVMDWNNRHDGFWFISKWRRHFLPGSFCAVALLCCFAFLVRPTKSKASSSIPATNAGGEGPSWDDMRNFKPGPTINNKIMSLFHFGDAVQKTSVETPPDQSHLGERNRALESRKKIAHDLSVLLNRGLVIFRQCQGLYKKDFKPGETISKKYDAWYSDVNDAFRRNGLDFEVYHAKFENTQGDCKYDYPPSCISPEHCHVYCQISLRKDNLSKIIREIETDPGAP